MTLARKALVSALAVAGLAGAAVIPDASAQKPYGASFGSPRTPGALPAHRGGARPAHPGGHRHRPGGHGYRGHGNHVHWGWGLGLGVGLPWLLGWHDPWWGPAYYRPYVPDPVYRGFASACEEQGDCWRDRVDRGEPAPPTTEVAPGVPGEEGGPTQRPLHLNYCDSARAWFPQVRTCAGGWRLVLPAYAPGS